MLYSVKVFTVEIAVTTPSTRERIMMLKIPFLFCLGVIDLVMTFGCFLSTKFKISFKWGPAGVAAGLVDLPHKYLSDF